MNKRIKMLISPSSLTENAVFLVYKDTVSPVGEHSLIEVNERDADKRLINEVGEKLLQSADNPLDFTVRRTFIMQPLPQIYIDGTAIPNTDVTYFPADRMVRIMNQNLEVGTTKAVTMDYQYFVSVVTDDWSRPQNGVTFHDKEVLNTNNPAAPYTQYFKQDIISGLNPPDNVVFTYDAQNAELQLNLTPDVTPHGAYYKMVLKDELTGELSAESYTKYIEVTPDLNDVQYRLERQKEDGTWEHVATHTGFTHLLQGFSSITNNPPPPISVTLTRLSDTECELAIQNPWIDWQLNTRESYKYRYRTEEITALNEKQVSEWKEYSTAPVAIKPLTMKIRRKEENGTPAQYTGLDALDMWDFTETAITKTITGANETPANMASLHTFTLLDDHLQAGRIYNYTFYIEDEAGMISLPFSFTI